VHKYFIPNANCKLQHAAFKVIPLRSNTLRHPPLSCVHALLEGSVWNCLELLHHGHFNGFYVRNLCSYHDSLELREQEKITVSQTWWVCRLLQHSNVIFGKKFPDTQCTVCWSIVMVKQSLCFYHTFVTSSLTLTASNVTGCPCKCAGWWSGPVARILRAQFPSN